jgi:hypothetical protein
MGPVTPIPEEKPKHEIEVPLDLARHFDDLEWGFDTVAIALRPEGSLATAALKTPVGGREPLLDPDRGTVVTDPDGLPTRVSVSAAGNWTMKLGFATVQGFPDAGFLRIEGRAAALIARDARAVGLVKPCDLSRVEGSILMLAWSILGGKIFIPSDILFRRWDLAVDVRTSAEPTRSRQIIRALGSVRLPYWGRADIHHARMQDDIVTGAAWPATGRRQFRVYDKGVEQKHPRHRIKDRNGKLRESPHAEEPGVWLRLERQIRPTNPEYFLRRDELEEADLRRAFVGRWASLLKAPSITACGTYAAQARVADLLRSDGGVGVQTARRLIGEIAAAAQNLDSRLFGSHQALARELASHGIVLAGDLPTSEQIELKPLLEAAARSWPSPAE